MKYGEKIKLLCCMPLVVFIFELKLSGTCAPLMTAETHSREDQRKEKEAENPQFQNKKF